MAQNQSNDTNNMGNDLRLNQPNSKDFKLAFIHRLFAASAWQVRMGYQFGLKKTPCYTYDNTQTDSNKRWEYVELCTV